MGTGLNSVLTQPSTNLCLYQVFWSHYTIWWSIQGILSNLPSQGQYSRTGIWYNILGLQHLMKHMVGLFLCGFHNHLKSFATLTEIWKSCLKCGSKLVRVVFIVLKNKLCHGLRGAKEKGRVVLLKCYCGVDLDLHNSLYRHRERSQHNSEEKSTGQLTNQ